MPNASSDWLPVHPAPRKVERTKDSAPASLLDSVSERIGPDEVPQVQGYRLSVTPSGVELVGHDEPGLFYGRQTVAQLRLAYSEALPTLRIDDWPDLQLRGYMLDISRDRVPKLRTIKELIDRLARLKINQLQLYTEHTVAYEGHESVWGAASPLTFDDLAELENYCRTRHIDLVPCQNLFGHLHRWLTKPDYEDLAEVPDGWDTPWNYRDPLPFSLNPQDPRSFELSADLIDQLAPKLKSDLFNIGCDETTDIGQGKSKALVERVGRAAVYLEYLQKLCGRVQQHGKTPMFWGDIVVDHPELVPQIPDEAVLLNWNYEATKSFGPESKQFRDAGVRFYVCPGTSSWCSLTGRGQNAIDNLRDAAEAGLIHGAEGYLITDWGDHGHWQPFANSWVGLTYGAGVAWCLESNRDTATLPQAIDLIAAEQIDDGIGSILWEMSNVYRLAEPTFINQTWMFRYLKSPGDPFTQEPWDRLTPTDIERGIAGLEAVLNRIEAYRPEAAESRRLREEAEWSTRLALWSARQVAKVLAGADPWTVGPNDRDTYENLVEAYRQRWDRRYRPGGLEDSVSKLTLVLRGHEAVSVNL